MHTRSECLRKCEADHGAEHHRRSLREVDRLRDRVGDVKAEREQAVHAAETNTSDEGGKNDGCAYHALSRLLGAPAGAPENGHGPGAVMMAAPGRTNQKATS
jgi:hypothetical protein